MDIDEEQLDDDALLAQAGAYLETEQQQAMLLDLNESELPHALGQQHHQQQQQQCASKTQAYQHGTQQPGLHQHRPQAPPPVQDDEDLGFDFEAELEEYQQEQQQRQHSPVAVLEDDFFPEDVPAQKQSAPPRQHTLQQQLHATEAARPPPATPAPLKRLGSAATAAAASAAGGASLPKRPRTEPLPHAPSATDPRSAPTHAGHAAAAPDDLDYLFEDGVAPPQLPAGAAPAAALPAGPCLGAHIGGAAGGGSAPPTPLAPAYKAPRFMASEVDGDCMPVTAFSGLRVYCELHGPPHAKSTMATTVQAGSAGARARGVRGLGAPPADFALLAKPVRQMMQELEEVRMNQLLSDSRALAEARHDRVGGGQPASTTPPRQQDPAPQAPGGSSLWVNKYAPQTFMGLLSDEQTNRAVAKWVKSWDPCVFGTGTGPSLHKQQKQQQQQQQQGARGRGSKGGKQAGGGKASDTRPECKAILLAGPPGLGKTTLAHVVARHCGYEPYEINASDDRTATALTQRVTDAVQMKPVLGSKKPNLVIIDEIDGATGGAEGHSAIAALIKIVTAGTKQQPGKAAEEDAEEGAEAGKDGAKAGGRKGRGLPPLARPLICIANDLYAPALRPLREVAQIFQFKEPNVEKLVSRLQHICNLEHVRIDKSALYALVQRAGVDIRSCLNTLQLLAKQAAQMQRPSRGLAHRPPPYIKAKQVEQLNIGIKDTTKGVFAVWDELLHLPGRGGVGALHLGPASNAGGAMAGGGRIQQLYSALQDFGEHELVMAGLHENLHNVHFLDVHMRKTSELLDALAQADVLIGVARRTISMHLLGYVPATALLVHLSAAQQEKPHLVWPKPISEASRRAHASLELMRSWATHRVTPRVLQAYDVRTLITEVGPALVRVLAPSLRAMAPHLLTPSEHAAIRHTTAVMVNYGLSYCLVEDGQQQAGRALQGAKPFNLAAAPVPGGLLAPAPRPVPLVPEIDRVVHNYPLAPAASSAAVALPSERKGRGSAARAAQEGVQAAPVRPVPLVLRQMLNQQVLLSNILHAEASGEQLPELATPGSAGKENTPAGRGARQQPRGTPSRMRTVSFMGEEEEGEEKEGGAKQQQAQQPQQPPQPQEQAQGDGGQGPGKTEGKPLAPVNWLTSLRTSMSNKRKHQQHLQQQQNKNHAGSGATGSPNTPSGKAGKPQFSKLYRFNEGYTNAVKRPLTIKDLL